MTGARLPLGHGALHGAAIIVGLRAEARLARRLGAPVHVGGGTRAGAEAACRRAVEQGAVALISFGLAGGLDPALRPGMVIVPQAVVTAGGVLAADPALGRALGGITPHRILDAAAIAADAAAKQQLHAASGAEAVDLESGPVARVATQRGLPFAVLRVICDPAERALPPAALAALDHRGAIGIFRVLCSVCAHPAQIAALLALARDAAAARRMLRHRIASIVAAA